MNMPRKLSKLKFGQDYPSKKIQKLCTHVHRVKAPPGSGQHFFAEDREQGLILHIADSDYLDGVRMGEVTGVYKELNHEE